MPKIIAIANQKGGVGKTTTAINLSAILASLGKQILLIDLDPQGNLTSGLGIDRNTGLEGTYDLLLSDKNLEEVITPTPYENLFLLASTQDLLGAEVELTPQLARESRLKFRLNDASNKWDFVFIDCPPSLGLLTINALTASNTILMPVQCEYYALEGLSQLVNTIELVKKSVNPTLEIEGILLTMHDSRTNLSNQVIEEVRIFFKEKVYNTTIPRTIRLSEAPSFGKPIIHYDPKSSGSLAYKAFAKEFLARNGIEADIREQSGEAEGGVQRTEEESRSQNVDVENGVQSTKEKFRDQGVEDRGEEEKIGSENPV